MNILQLNSSIHSDTGQSSVVASELTAALAAPTRATVTLRNLAREPLPHLDAPTFAAFTTPTAQRTPEQQVAVALSDTLIAELRAADVIIIAAPMYNYGVPSQLKAWFDHVARAGVTFRYTATGPQGLLTGKKAYVVSTRGGLYAGTQRDSQTPHLREFLALLGISEVEFIYAEGMALGDAPRNAALSNASAHVARLVPLALAA